MPDFLKAVANSLYQDHGDDLENFCVVFPNRRAGVFFNKYLSEAADKPIWSPSVCTISDLMLQLSGFQQDDPLNLIYELYRIYVRARKTEESFDSFYYWGEILLNDFDDLDKNLVNARHLFENLADIKDIEEHFDYLTEEQIEAIRRFWLTFTPKKHSVHQEDFITTWSVLADIYEEFTALLTSGNTGYEGLIYRKVANLIDNGDIALRHKTYVFTGFNVLNPCEEKLFTFLQKRKSAVFYWDYDEYYISQTYHEAGQFLNSNLIKYPPLPLDCSFSQLTSPSKEIVLISAPSVISQAKVINSLIRETGAYDKSRPENTAIILPDENLLIPVLYSLPPDTGLINITMGYPLKSSPAFSLIGLLSELQKTAKNDGSGNWLFYFREVIQLLNHSFVNTNDDGIIRDIISHISLKNRIYIPAGTLSQNQLLSLIFKKTNDFDEFAEYLLRVLHYIFSGLKKEGNAEGSLLQQEFIYHVYLTVKKLRNLLKKWETPPTFETSLKILDKILNSLRIPFTGEPLAGLQIMGILETRALDFRNIIVLSMNEGIFPSTGQQLSFIPQSLRKGFNLTTTEHHDAVFAYYFYRLLQRPGKVFLVWCNRTEGMKPGEMSRYLFQLKYDNVFHVTERNLYFETGFSSRHEISVKNSPEIRKKLERFIAGNEDPLYLSPSAINTFLDCKLKFYFRYIASLEEPEEVSEEIDPMIFGNILHKTLNGIYAGFPGGIVTEAGLQKITEDRNLVENKLLDAFNSEYFGNANPPLHEELAGRNILIFEVLRKYLLRIIETDMSFTPFRIVELEKKYLYGIPVESGGKKLTVSTGGRIDRIDEVNGNIRIIDYKTGSANNRFPNPEALFQNGDDKRNKAALQSLFYAALYNRSTGNTKPVQPGLYILKELYGKKFRYLLEYAPDDKNYQPLTNYTVLAEDFESLLYITLSEIFNPELVFSQVENESICRYCPYVSVCGK